MNTKKETAQEYKENNFGRPVAAKTIATDPEGFAKVFAEGNKGLEKCLLTCWKYNIPTLACCGEYGFFNRNSYISICTDGLKKGNTFMETLKKMKGRKRTVYDPVYGTLNNSPLSHIFTVYCKQRNAEKFFHNLAIEIEKHCLKQEKKRRN